MNFDVDNAFCISLKERNDRRLLLDEQFKFLCNDVSYYLAERDTVNPERGCFNSHRSVAEIGVNNNYERVLIFEDDVVFDRVISNRLNNIVNNFLSREGWDIFFLGGLLGQIWPTSQVGIVGCNMVCAHAYILSKSGMRKIVDSEYGGMPVDVLYATTFKSYSVFPFFASQLSNDVTKSDLAEYCGREGLINQSVWSGNNRAQYVSLFKNIKNFEWLR